MGITLGKKKRMSKGEAWFTMEDTGRLWLVVNVWCDGTVTLRELNPNTGKVDLNGWSWKLSPNKQEMLIRKDKVREPYNIERALEKIRTRGYLQQRQFPSSKKTALEMFVRTF